MSDDLHVWRSSLIQPAEHLCALEETLSADEMARAKSFYFEQDRRRFVAGRGVLRDILGRYLGIEPRQLQFRYGKYGKPYLANSHGEHTLYFNVSHSNELALYVLAYDREVGIDIEYIHPLPDLEQIVSHFFSAREKTALEAISGDLKTEAFFACWTRKEAYIKARGDGLSLPLDQFDVSLAPGEPAKLLSSTQEDDVLWSLLDVAPGDGYVGAVAVQEYNGLLSRWHYDC